MLLRRLLLVSLVFVVLGLAAGCGSSGVIHISGTGTPDYLQGQVSSNAYAIMQNYLTAVVDGRFDEAIELLFYFPEHARGEFVAIQMSSWLDGTGMFDAFRIAEKTQMNDYVYKFQLNFSGLVNELMAWIPQTEDGMAIIHYYSIYFNDRWWVALSPGFIPNELRESLELPLF